MEKFVFGKPIGQMTESDVYLSQMSYFTPDSVAELSRSADTLNRKGMRSLIDRIEKKYKEDIKKINDNCRKELVKAEQEMREEISHFYMGSMYAMFVACMKDAGLADRTVNRVLNYLAGNLNALETGDITISDIKDYIENEHGFKVVFDAKRNMIGMNMFEEANKDGKAEKKSKGK